MKNLLFLVFLILFLNEGISQVHVKGYYRKDGTYVQPHYRSNPDGNPYNNWSYPGNVNPYTGKVATGNPSTYLANYYKTYSTGHSDRVYNNYTSVLCYTNYKGLKKGGSYSLTNNSGAKTGNVDYYKDRTFRIFDDNHRHIGYVETNRNGRRYVVYDLYGYQVTSNKNNIDAVPIILSVGALAIAIIAVSYEDY